MKTQGFTTAILHSDRQSPIEHGSTLKPIHTSVAYCYKSAEEIAAVFQGREPGYSYARQGNPTVAALEQKITRMEGGLASICFATGMAAITTTMLSLLRSGDHVVSSAFLFGNTNSFFNTLANFGIEVSFVDATDAQNVAAAIRPNTRMVFVETIANPCTQISDLAAIGELCAEQGLLFIVDNTMTSPWNFRPVTVKAGLVINSLTKFIGGHGNALGGAVTDSGLFDWESFPNIYDNYKTGAPRNWGLLQIRKKGLRDTGASLSAEVAHHIAMGAETLALRQERSAANALALARFFAGHPAIKRVFYPGLASHPEHERAKALFRGFGSLMSIELVPEKDCFAFINALKLVILSTNLGDNRTLAIPVAHTIFHEMGPERRASMGIADGTVRLAIGIEDIEDLIADFSQALG